jgi:hypothetical protein
MDLRGRPLVWRTGLLLRRAAWERRRQLVRELAEYRTPAERDDLLAAIERCPHNGREEVRRLLAQDAWRADLTRSPFHLHRA